LKIRGRNWCTCFPYAKNLDTLVLSGDGAIGSYLEVVDETTMALDISTPQPRF
jgi:hypothetical protein